METMAPEAVAASLTATMNNPKRFVLVFDGARSEEKCKSFINFNSM